MVEPTHVSWPVDGGAILKNSPQCRDSAESLDLSILVSILFIVTPELKITGASSHVVTESGPYPKKVARIGIQFP